MGAICDLEVFGQSLLVNLDRRSAVADFRDCDEKPSTKFLQPEGQ
jgi:hypothetical protein